MEEFEQKMTALIQSATPDTVTFGLIKGEVSDDSEGLVGSCGPSADEAEKWEIVELLNDVETDAGDDYFSLLGDAREASQDWERGPIYRFNIDIAEGKFSYTYFCENDPFDSVEDLEPDLDGCLPDFYLREHFTEEAIGFLDGQNIDNALFIFVPAQQERGEEIEDQLLDMYAMADWQCDLFDGGPNQYFIREFDITSQFKRDELYPHVRQALKTLQCEQGLAIFDEMVALFAHFIERVEKSRAAMGIAEVEKQTQTDVGTRYFEICDELDQKRRDYIKQHASQFAVS